MKRVFVDISGFGLLFGLVQLLPTNASIVVGLFIPFLVGFGRGFVERRFLRKIPYWIAAVEWGLVVSASDIILCLPNSSDPYTNFWTRFGAFFLIFIVPSIALSVGGFIAAVTWQNNRHLA
jgi:hypothetical protein